MDPPPIIILQSYILVLFVTDTIQAIVDIEMLPKEKNKDIIVI